MIQKLIQKLTNRLQLPLPGKNAQYRMAPSFRNESSSDKNKAVTSSVLLLFWKNEENTLLTLIKRSSQMRNHRGQISFPGGKHDKTDQSLQATALRETEEEIGIPKTNIKILGALTPIHIPISNFMVHPFVGYSQKKLKTIPNPAEVEEVLQLPINELLDSRNIKFDSWEKNNKIHTCPYYSFQGHKIWGATAMIISELLQILEE